MGGSRTYRRKRGSQTATSVKAVEPPASARSRRNRPSRWSRRSQARAGGGRKERRSPRRGRGRGRRGRRCGAWRGGRRRRRRGTDAERQRRVERAEAAEEPRGGGDAAEGAARRGGPREVARRGHADEDLGEDVVGESWQPGHWRRRRIGSRWGSAAGGYGYRDVLRPLALVVGSFRSARPLTANGPG